MKVLYHQKKNSPLFSWGLGDCYLKLLTFSEDRFSISEKQHHHNGYEIHIILSGCQFYEIADQKYAVDAGHFLMIPPGTKHRTEGIQEQTRKISLTFRTDPSLLCFSLTNKQMCYFGELPTELSEALAFMEQQTSQRTELSSRLLESRYYETVALLFRAAGISEEQPDSTTDSNSHLILPMAKQYITDNIESSPTIDDIVLYCGLSERQLSRVFLKHEGITLFDYIRRARTAHIEELLTNSALSIKEISERMNFANEYYFNTFCKKNCGMPPKTYRKMRIDNPQFENEITDMKEKQY